MGSINGFRSALSPLPPRDPRLLEVTRGIAIGTVMGRGTIGKVERGESGTRRGTLSITLIERETGIEITIGDTHIHMCTHTHAHAHAHAHARTHLTLISFTSSIGEGGRTATILLRDTPTTRPANMVGGRKGEVGEGEEEEEEEEGEREGDIPRSLMMEHTQALRGRETGGGGEVGGEGEGDATGVSTHLEAAAEVEHTCTFVHVHTGPTEVAISFCVKNLPILVWLR